MFAFALIYAGLLLNPTKPQLDYRLRVDTTDLRHVTIELRVRQAPANMTLAAAAHPEYDDKYWRYIQDLRATDAAGNSIAWTRADSVLWRLSNRAGDVLVSYRLELPVEALPRAAWRPFLTRTGGLVGGPHMFLYVLNAEKMPAQLTVDVPRGWKIATALQPTGSGTFSTPDLETLMESPLQVGLQSEWRFEVGGVPHRIVYWRLPNAMPFDTVAFVDGIQRIVRGAIDLFGSTPYPAYTFMFQDGAYGGLEHPVSVTLGAPSADLATNPQALLLETAHEFFHTWNLMHITPVEYLGLDYRTQPPVASLWFSEGLTLFYADLLARRAGLRAAQPTRVAHLETMIARYVASPGQSHFSAEQISRVAYNAGPGALGDYSAGVHLNGEVIGAVLDLKVRAATTGSKSMDDVMRRMNERFGARGFTGRDVQQAVEDVCACKADDVFDRHVRAANAIDFNRYLELIGLHASVSWEPALERDGRPMRDIRLFAYDGANEDGLRLVISDPGTAWGRAGLHTQDVLVSINGRSVKELADFRAKMNQLTMGDTATLIVLHDGVSRSFKVPVTGYDRPVVRIEESANATPEQRRMLEAWKAGR